MCSRPRPAPGASRCLIEITTAGWIGHSICFEHHDYSIKVLEGILQDDSWFAFIAAADENDDWTDPAVWRKANPSFGLSVKEDDLTRKAEKAIALPGAQNAFRRMHLNEWTEQAERWIDLAAWDACDAPVDLDRLARAPVLRRARSVDHHRRHRARLGVAARHTTTTSGGCSPATSCRRSKLRKRAERDRVPYDLWAAEGLHRGHPRQRRGLWRH